MLFAGIVTCMCEAPQFKVQMVILAVGIALFVTGAVLLWSDMEKEQEDVYF